MRLSILVGALLLLGAASPGLAEVAGAEQALIAPLAARSLLLAAASSGDRMVIVGERGHVLISPDAGASWTQVGVPTRATLTGVTLASDSLGFAVGHDATILRTRDGGASWERVFHAPEEERPLLAVLFLDERRGFAVGAYGFFLATEDGGETWEPRAVTDQDLHFNHIARAANGALYLAAEAGLLLRSDDEGATWRELSSPYDGSFFGTLPLDGGRILAFGLRGHLYQSEDGGASWRRIEVPTTALLTSASVLADGTVVVTGMAGTLLESRDGGTTFVSRALDDRRGILGVVQAADGSVHAIGEGGVQRLTSAGGGATAADEGGAEAARIASEREE